MFSVLRNVLGEDQLVMELKENSTLRDAIDQLARLYAGTYKEKTGKNLVETLKNELQVSVDGKKIDFSEGMSVELHEDSVVMIFEPVIGG